MDKRAEQIVADIKQEMQLKQFASSMRSAGTVEEKSNVYHELREIYPDRSWREIMMMIAYADRN